MSSIEDPMNKRNALLKILNVLQKVPALTSYYGASISALILILTNTDPALLPPALGSIAGGIGINLLSNMIERIAHGEMISDEEIENAVKRALEDSEIGEALTKEEFRIELEKLILTQQFMYESLMSQLLQNKQQKFNKIQEVTIAEAIERYIENISIFRSSNTVRTYRNGLNSFSTMLNDHGISIDSTNICYLNENLITWFVIQLSQLSPSTEELYLTAIKAFYEFINSEYGANLNIAKINDLISNRIRKPVYNLPHIPVEQIEKVLEYAKRLVDENSISSSEQLRNLRDRAFLITLADTGLRVHEACKLRRGDIDWNEGKAVITGKGNRQAVIRFSNRSIQALRDYINARSKLDGASGKPLTSLPLFARHDRGAGKKVKPITTRTGQNIISQRVKESLGADAVGTITPHSFRHYFVTTVLRASGNLKLAQELARHRNIAVTQRYAHLSDDELDQGYWEIFEN